jgi:hypothetical protein
MAVSPVFGAGAATPANGLESPYTLPTAADEGGRTATSISTPSGTTSFDLGGGVFRVGGELVMRGDEGLVEDDGE